MGNKPSTPPNDEKTRHEQLVEELHYHTTEDMIEYNKKTKKPYKSPKKDYKDFFNEFKKIFNEEKIYLIVDENTIQHIDYLEENFSVTSTHLKLESGEKNKTFNSVLKIWDFLNRNNVKSS